MANKIQNGENGNIFTVLIGAVALVGVVSIASMNMLSGPIATSAKVMNKTMADSQMFANNKIVVLSATNQANSGDCDSDTYIEPSPWRDASGNGPDGVTGSQGGGFLPSNLGLTTTDPWGTEYGYCVWDVGTVDDVGCGGAAQLRLAGSPDPSAGNVDTQYVQALISAGPDRIFQTQCKDYVNTTTAILVMGGDDIVQPYTYNEASAAGTGLWDIQAGNVAVATIDKAIKFADQTASITCDANSANAMRYNAITNSIQKCDGAAGTWSDISSGGGGGAFSLDTTSTPNVVYNNGDQTTDDFVFGSPQLADDGNAAHDNRMWFDKSKGAFRAGGVSNTQWDDANVGSYSVAIGSENIALGTSSVAIGQNVDVTGNSSFAFGLGVPTGANPTVSGANSFGIFMGDQSGVNVAVANTMAILGGDFVVGSPQLADAGASHDSRMFFDKSKATFRAGGVSSSQWDDINVGAYSFAVGRDTTASGTYSFAAGQGSIASGMRAVAIGGSANATGNGSVAIGIAVDASRDSSIAIGKDSTSSGARSIAIGQYNTASGNTSVAIGGYSTASNYALALGTNATADGYASVALGSEVQASGSHSYAFSLGNATGTYPQVSGNNSFGIFMGDQSGINVTAANTMAILGGNLVVGATAVTAGYKMDIIGDLRVQGSGTTCAIGTGTGATNCTSDARLKKDIVRIPNALDKISKLNGVTFKWKDESKDKNTHMGVIAQNIEKTFPEIVIEMPDGMKAVDYAALVSPLIEATKELKAKNEKLENEVSTLKNDIEKLKTYTGYKHDKASIANLFILSFMGAIFAIFGFSILRRKTTS